MAAQGLHMAAQGLQMQHIAAYAVYGCWLAGHRDHRIQSIRPEGANELVPGAHTYILQTADCRIQDANYSIQACRHRWIRRCKDTRMQRIQDAGLKHMPHSLLAPKGAGGYIALAGWIF